MADHPGPVMLAATNMMRPPPTRIGKLGKNFSLPRTVPILSVVAFGAGAFIGLIPASIVLAFGGSLLVFAMVALGFGALGVATVTMSPMKNESLAKWLGLNLLSFATKKVEINGRPAKVYIGMAQLEFTATGKVRMFPGAVNVASGSVDDRGVIIPHSQVLEERRRQAATVRSHTDSWAPTKNLPKDGAAARGGAPKATPERVPDPVRQKPKHIAQPKTKKLTSPRQR